MKIRVPKIRFTLASLCWLTLCVILFLSRELEVRRLKSDFATTTAGLKKQVDELEWDVAFRYDDIKDLKNELKDAEHQNLVLRQALHDHWDFSKKGLGSLDFQGRTVVVSVNRGDSITVRDQGTIREVRIRGVRCQDRGEAYGEAALEYVRDTCFLKDIELSNLATSERGWIADVTCDSKEIALFLLWNGLAECDDPSIDRLATVEATAKQAKRGLWADAHRYAK